MLISKLIYKIFPKSVFVKLRRIYRYGIKSVNKAVSEAEFRKILVEKLKIKKGSVVFIHSSLDFLNVEFNPHRVLEILIETVGDEGTLVFPCWHFSFRAEDYLRTDQIFDVRRSPSVMGMLSELARRYPGSFRSLHPTNSIVAIGKNAEYIINEHHTDIYPCGRKSPYFKVMELNGIIAGIGVDCTFMSFVHCVEDTYDGKFPLKTRLDEIFVADVKDYDKNMIQIKTLAAHPMIKNNDIRAFVRKHISAEACSNITIRGNRFFRADASILYLEMVKNAKAGNTIYTKTW